jgi:hypothetical protein
VPASFRHAHFSSITVVRLFKRRGRGRSGRSIQKVAAREASGAGTRR